MLRKKLKFDSINTNDAICTGTVPVSDETESVYFQKPFWKELYDIQHEMNIQFKSLQFGSPIEAVYNPTIYAKGLHCAYLEKYLSGPKQIMFLGMNPGPWGMCQTGVPFGYIPAVRDWLKLDGQVDKPNPEILARPITGLCCMKNEQSGKRWWGLIEKLCETPENFFRNCFIQNYCALAFFTSTGKNITPSELKSEIKLQLQNICNDGLVKAIELISPKIIICIGTYTKDRALGLQKKNKIDDKIEIVCMPHPSPRSLNNTNWGEKAENWFIEHNIIQYLK